MMNHANAGECAGVSSRFDMPARARYYERGYLEINTVYTPGALTTRATAYFVDNLTHAVYRFPNDFTKMVEVSYVSRCTQDDAQAQHDLAVANLDAYVAEVTAFYFKNAA